jgi:hypothetical protein
VFAADGLSAEAADFAEVEHLQVEFEALQLVQVDLAGEQVGVLLQAWVKGTGYLMRREGSRFAGRLWILLSRTGLGFSCLSSRANRIIRFFLEY